jgi:hypothetical protein
MALRIDPDCANGLHEELARLQVIGASPTTVVYSPLILNTILIMFYFSQKFGNLFVPMEVAPYGGYQLTLTNNSASETPADFQVNENVNRLIHSFMTVPIKEDILNTKIAISLMFIDPLNAANNHANIILFLKIVNKWYVYHYEPHGRNLAHIFPKWFRTGSDCITAMLERLKLLDVDILVKPHLQTRIKQTPIDQIQNVSEGGYCQMISALQAYLFLSFCRIMSSDPTTNTPLGSSIKSPKNSIGNTIAQYQLQIIRGFVSFISGEIQALLTQTNIHFRIDKISQINAYYQAQRDITGRYRPLYLYYLDAVLRFITSEIQKGTIHLLPCQQGEDCRGLIIPHEVGTDFAELDKIVTPLLGMLNGGIVLTKAAKLKLYSDIRTAEREAALDKTTQGRKGSNIVDVKEHGGFTRKHKKRKTKRKQRNRRRRTKRMRSRK